MAAATPETEKPETENSATESDEKSSRLKLILILGGIAAAILLALTISTSIAISKSRALADEKRDHEKTKLAMTEAESAAKIAKSNRELAEAAAVESSEKAAAAVADAAKARDEKREANEDASSAHRSRATAEIALTQMLAELQTQLAPVGRLPLLEASAARAAEYFEALPEQHRGASTQIAQANLLEHLGDVSQAAGKLENSISAYQKSVELRRGAIQAAADPSSAHEALSAGLTKLGDAQVEAGKPDEALAAYEESLEILKSISMADQNDSAPKSAVADAFVKIGEAHVAGERIEDAVAAFQEAQEIVKELAAVDPSVLEFQREVCAGLARLGDCELALGNPDEARKLHAERLERVRSLCASNPDSDALQGDLSSALAGLGEVSEPELAVLLFEENVNVLSALVEKNPIDPTSRQALALAQDRLGDARAAEDPIAAAIHYRASIKTVQQLLAADQAPEIWRLKQIVTLCKLAELDEKRGAPEIAAGRYNEALAWLRDMEEAGLLSEEDAKWIAKVQTALEKLNG